jgi:hypothetical protein
MKKRTIAERRDIERYGSAADRVSLFVGSLFDLDIPADLIANSLETYAAIVRHKK